MKLSIDAAERSVSFALPRALYSDDAVRIAAHVFASRADAYHEETKSEHDLTLVAKRKDAKAADLETLAGDFHNELLNQEYRFDVARFNRKIADLIVTQCLLAARGGEPPAARAPETAEFKAEAARLMAEAKDEARRTMPKKIASKGIPFPPEYRAP
jgi:His-Xaa-Ser system protein HxsD